MFPSIERELNINGKKIVIIEKPKVKEIKSNMVKKQKPIIKNLKIDGRVIQKVSGLDTISDITPIEITSDITSNKKTYHFGIGKIRPGGIFLKASRENDNKKINPYNKTEERKLSKLEINFYKQKLPKESSDLSTNGTTLNQDK